MSLLLLAALAPVLFWDKGPETADQLKQAGITRIAVPPANEAAWKSQAGLAVSAVDTAQTKKLVTPGMVFRANEATASRSPWVSTNGWQFQRSPEGRYFYNAPGAASLLAAAEAFIYGADAVVQTDAAGLAPLGEMLAFLGQLKPSGMPPAADIGFIDDGSPEAGEVMNLMTRKNLQFRVVRKPDPKLDLNVPFGSAKYPKAQAVNPAEMVQKIRFELTDDKRAFRVYGSEVVLGRLESDGRRLRIHLLNYGGVMRPVNGVRIRVEGRFPQHQVKVAGYPDAALLEFDAGKDATEFTIKELKTYAVVDLSR
jgi:hypothetical protein